MEDPLLWTIVTYDDDDKQFFYSDKKSLFVCIKHNFARVNISF